MASGLVVLCSVLLAFTSSAAWAAGETTPLRVSVGSFTPPSRAEHPTVSSAGGAQFLANQAVTAPGRQAQNELIGLYYFRHRYYDPETGRFVQRDPIWDPGNVGNQYSFVGNGPNDAMDPLGLSPGFIDGWYAGSVAFGKGLMALGKLLMGKGDLSKMNIDKEMVIDILAGLALTWGRLITPAFVIDVAYAISKAGFKAAYLAKSASQSACVFGFELAKGLGGAFLGAGLGMVIKALGRGLGALGRGGDDAARAADNAAGSKVPEPNSGGGARVPADGPGCFLAGTYVDTRSGRKRIEDIQATDEVLSRDEATGEQGYKRVVRLFRGHTDQVVYLRIAKAASTQRGRSESHRVGETSGGSEESDEPPLPNDDTQTIRCTTEHPFWVVGQGFVAAKDLRVGQRGLDSEGNEVVYVGIEIRQEEADHFNFEVEDFHTYFVSETEQDPAVWVHNRCFQGKVNRLREMRAEGGAWQHRGDVVRRAVTPEQAAAIRGGGGITKPTPFHRTTPTQHVGGTKHARDPWTSTTRRPESAEFFATYGGKRPANPIIEIDLNRLGPGQVLDVSTPGLASQLTTRFARRAAAKHQEVLIHGDIPRSAILGFVD